MHICTKNISYRLQHGIALFLNNRGKYGCNLYNVSYIDNELDQQPEDTLLVVNIQLYEGIQMKTKIPQHGNWRNIVE